MGSDGFALTEKVEVSIQAALQVKCCQSSAGESHNSGKVQVENIVDFCYGYCVCLTYSQRRLKFSTTKIILFYLCVFKNIDYLHYPKGGTTFI